MNSAMLRLDVNALIVITLVCAPAVVVKAFTQNANSHLLQRVDGHGHGYGHWHGHSHLNQHAFLNTSAMRIRRAVRSGNRNCSRHPVQLFGFFDDLMKGFEQGQGQGQDNGNKKETKEDGEDLDLELNEADFMKELQRRKENTNANANSNANTGNNASESDSNVMIQQEEKEFDGYDFRDAIYNKWGQCFDVDFQPVTTFGFRELYLNVLPFRLGGRRFRHDTELDYLCHLQAVVEILVKYEQLDYVLQQLEETNKKPRAGTSPLVAVPIRLDLTEEELNSILQ